VGYRAVEFAGYGGWPADELKAYLNELALAPVSSHVPWERLTTHVDDEIVYAQTLGLQYLVCPALPEAVRRAPASARATLEQIGAACGAAGLTFGYHNHAFELTERGPDGKPLLDALLEGTDRGRLVAEFDLYWLARGGADPIAYLKRFAGRVPLLHVKDMAEDHQHDTEVGAGILPWPDLWEAARETQVAWLFVEQEDFEDSAWPRIARSLAFLRQAWGDEGV
jgi:sugar phosphate isomerase/epimerase